MMLSSCVYMAVKVGKGGTRNALNSEIIVTNM